MEAFIEAMWEAITALFWVICYWLEAVVIFFIPHSYRRKSVEGQKVLITGAGSGLGRGMAERFSRLGCELILWDVNQAGNEKTGEMCRDLGAKVHTYTCDLTKKEEVYAQAGQVKAEIGDVDILVNNAGIVTGRKMLDCPDELMIATMNVNCNANFWTLKSFLPSMLARNHGHIVTVASGAGTSGVNGLVDYCASKFGAVGLHEALNAELDALGKAGVHATLVCPGYIDTGMFTGANIKWAWALPLLQPDYVCDRIIEAVLINQEFLMTPRILYFALAFKALAPVKAWKYFARVCGMSSSMDNFVGHSKSQ